MKYIPHTSDEIKEMLSFIGKQSIDELFEVIPSELRKNSELKLSDPIDDITLEKELIEIAESNKASQFECFIGGGIYDHYIASPVNQLLSRTEFLTAYTPYQPEVSQGTLQSIFEFQTIVSEIFGLDVANASLYDGASATAEAILMAKRLNNKPEFLISNGIHPEYRTVVSTYLKTSLEEKVIPLNSNGDINLELLEKKLTPAVGAIVLGYPNFFGVPENIIEAKKIAQKNGVLIISVTQEPLALGILKSPGEMGVDIAVGEGHSLANLPSCGGPGVGLIATKDDYKRQMPGRLVGQTVDSNGKRGFVLTLSTREQHIRRAKATSNICSNQNLIALSFLINISLLGKDGFKKLSNICLSKSQYLKDNLKNIDGFKLLFDGPTFNEFALKCTKNSADKILQKLRENGILAGPIIDNWYPQYKDSFLVATTEKRSKNTIDKFIKILRES